MTRKPAPSLLTGTGKTGRHLQITDVADIPRPAVRDWLRTAANLARGQK